eukprot:gene6831-10996_t
MKSIIKEDIKGNSKFSHPQRRLTSNSHSLKKRKMENKIHKKKVIKVCKNKTGIIYDDIMETIDMDKIPSAPLISNESLIRKYKTGSTQNVEIYSDDESFDEEFMVNIDSRGSMMKSTLSLHAEKYKGKVIYWIDIDNKNTSTNTITVDFALQLNSCIDYILLQPQFDAVIFRSLKKDSFIVGANIYMLREYMKKPEVVEQGLRQLHTIFNRVRQLKCMTIALINGSCLGGGLELALACDYRISIDSPKVKLGFPEVKLGLIPGAGGCAYTPHIIGLINSLDLCISGSLYDVKKSLKIGLIDEILKTDDTLKEAKEFSIKHTKSKKLPWNLLDKVVRNTDLGRALIYNQVINQLHSRTKLKYPAPYWILEILLETCESSILNAIDLESKSFEKLLKTPMAKKLTRLFIIQDNLKKSIEIDPSWILPKKVGVIGGGLTGVGFAHILLMKGFSVVLVEKKDETEIRKKIEFLLNYSEESHQIQKNEASQFLKNLEFSSDLSSLEKEDIDFVIEAVNEDLDSKQDVYSKLHKDQRLMITSSPTLVTSLSKFNTLGLYLTYPFHRTPIAEILTTKSTDEKELNKIFKFTKELGKVPIVLNQKPVSINLLGCLFCEVLEMITEGYPITVIQKEIRDFGFTIQVIELMDAIGLDEIQNWIKNNERFKENPILTKLIQENSLGKKTSKGFNFYNEKGALGKLNTTFKDELIEYKKVIPPKEKKIIERIIFRSLNESLYLIEEKVVDTEEVIDIISVSIGYPPDSGGICSIFRHWKPSDIIEKLKEFEKDFGNQFKPSSILLKRENSDRLFTDEKVKESTKKFQDDINFSHFPTPKQTTPIFIKWSILAVIVLGFIFFNFFIRYTSKLNK